MTPPDGKNARRAGEILLEEGLISPDDVTQVLSIQEKGRTALTGNRSRLFGMVLCDMSLVTPMDNYCALEKHGNLMTVGDYLVQKNILSPSKMDRLTSDAENQGLPLISFLLDKGVVAKSLLQQILFDLFHIPFRSVGDIVFEKGSRKILAEVISRETAGKHRCIPLQLTGPSLMVGITDPSNLVFLRDLDQAYPQYRFTPVFIPFSGFTWFYRLLYEKNWEGGKKPVDLSLLMKSSVLVTDPGGETDKILAFFDRYERVRGAGKAAASSAEGRRSSFLDFVRHHHKRITARWDCRQVRFSLKQEKGRLLVTAAPEGEAD